MSSRLRAIAGASLVAALVAAACSGKDGDNSVGKGGADAVGGEGGRAGSSTTRAGTTGRGGRGGTSATAGNTGTAAMGGADVSTAGTDAGAGGASTCPSCASGFCLDDGTCVDCLPSNDHCPAGQYCTDANQCVSGCKTDGSTCASGACDGQHNCTNCISDQECSDGLVCGNGQCGDACTLAQDGQSAACGESLTCCSLHCTDLATSSAHCGACGAACNAGDFCGIDACADGSGGAGQGGAGGAPSAPCVSCHPTVLANICSIARAVVILDTGKNSADGDRAPGLAMGAALEAKCNPTPTLTNAQQDSIEALNFTTGRPVSGGGELLIVAGGPVFQNLEVYVEEQHLSPLYWETTDTDTEYRTTAGNRLVLTQPIAGDHESHDLFIIQFMRDPASGSLVLNAQGFWLSGTVAAAFQLTNGILPSLSSFDKAWYAYEWTDLNSDKLPDLNEISLKDSGL